MISCVHYAVNSCVSTHPVVGLNYDIHPRTRNSFNPDPNGTTTQRSSSRRLLWADNNRLGLAQVADSLVGDLQMSFHQVRRCQGQPLSRKHVRSGRESDGHPAAYLAEADVLHAA